MEDPFKSLNKLKKLGLEVDAHILYEESCNPFFKWLLDNVTEENILTDYEIRQNDELKKDNLILPKTELNISLKELDKKYPNILNLTDNDLKLCEKELEELKKIDELSENLSSEVKKNINKLSEELNVLENRKIELDFFYNKISNECMEDAKYLQEIQCNNQQKLNELQQSFLKAHNPPLFICQLPLEQYTDKCEQVHKYIDVYMHRNFKIKNNLIDEQFIDEQINVDSYVEEIQGIKERIYGTENALLLKCMDLEGKQRLIKEMECGQWQPMTYENMKIETMEMTTKSNELLVYQNALLKELSTHLNQLAEQKLDFILYDYNKKKLERAKLRLENVQTISEIVTNATINADFVWMLMGFDLERVNNISSFIQSDQFTKDTYSCLKRIEELKGLVKPSMPSDICKKFNQELQAKMAKILDERKYRELSYDDCILEYKGITKGIKNHLKNIIDKKFDENFNQKLKKINAKKKLLFNYLADGPTGKPQLFDPFYSTQLLLGREKNNVIERIIKQLKNDHQKNIDEPMNSDKLWRFDQYLWIWFLTEPKKVLSAIKEVKIVAANQQSSAFKSISGIMCKQTPIKNTDNFI